MIRLPLALLLLAAAPASPPVTPAPFAPGVVIAVRTIARGAVVTAADLGQARARTLVLGALTDPEQAVGLIARHALAPGAVVRADALIAATIVKRGDPVTLRAGGRGFSVEARGAATADGVEGAGVAAVNSATGTRLRGAVSGDGSILLGALKVGGERP